MYKCFLCFGMRELVSLINPINISKVKTENHPIHVSFLRFGSIFKLNKKDH